GRPAPARSEPPGLAAAILPHVGVVEVTRQHGEVGQAPDAVRGLAHLVDLEAACPSAVVAGPDLHPRTGLQHVLDCELVDEPGHRPTSLLSPSEWESSSSAGAVPATRPKDRAGAGRPD